MTRIVSLLQATSRKVKESPSLLLEHIFERNWSLDSSDRQLVVEILKANDNFKNCAYYIIAKA